MPQVDFYILDSPALSARMDFLARFLQKLQKLGTSAYIAVDSEQAAQELDEQLWSSPPESFLPHARMEAGEAPPDEAFVISAQAEKAVAQQVYINLRREPPACHGQLQRLVEVVVQDPTVLAETRRHFAFYREHGYDPQSHTIRSN